MTLENMRHDDTASSDAGGHEVDPKGEGLQNETKGTGEQKGEATTADNPQTLLGKSDDPEGGSPSGDGEHQQEGKGEDPQEAKSMSAGDYEDFNIPDYVELNEGIMQEFKEFSATKGLSQKEAQSLIDMQLKVNAEQAEGWFKQTENWAKEIEADEVYGGKNFGKTVSGANAVLSSFDKSGKVTEFLKSSGYGNNPDIIRFLADIHKKHMADDVIIPGSEAWNEQKLVDRLWPDKN